MVFVNGILKSIDEIVNFYGDNIYRLAFSRTKSLTDGEDIVQEVFLKLMDSDRNFCSEEHLKAWLLRVTINKSKNLLNTAWFRKTTTLDDNLVFLIEEKSEVYKYVLELPSKYRVVIHLFYYEDLKTEEIAEILDIKQGTVRSQLTRARELLREKLKGVEIDVF
ncbi:MAG: RNA polymerase sigma factor [Sarcina sp.]